MHIRVIPTKLNAGEAPESILQKRKSRVTWRWLRQCCTAVLLFSCSLLPTILEGTLMLSFGMISIGSRIHFYFFATRNISNQTEGWKARTWPSSLYFRATMVSIEIISKPRNQSVSSWLLNVSQAVCSHKNVPVTYLASRIMHPNTRSPCDLWSAQRILLLSFRTASPKNGVM